MGTKSEWRKGKLRFYGDPMFSAVATQTTNVSLSGALSKTPTVVVACPIYANTMSTERNMHFHARIAGVTATSSATVLTATLRYNTTTILSCALPAKKFKAYNIPYNVDFYGRFANASSSGHIAAVAVGQIGSKPTTSFSVCAGTVGSTDGAGTKFSTSNINMAVDSTLGLNIVVSYGTTIIGAGAQANRITNTVGYIELFSG